MGQAASRRGSLQTLVPTSQKGGIWEGEAMPREVTAQTPEADHSDGVSIVGTKERALQHRGKAMP